MIALRNILLISYCFISYNPVVPDSENSLIYFQNQECSRSDGSAKKYKNNSPN